MRGDQHVGEREHPREDVVLQHLPGEVLEKDTFLLLINIQRDAAEPSGFGVPRSEQWCQSSAPRLTLRMITPGFIRSMVSRRMMCLVCGVRGR